MNFEQDEVAFKKEIWQLKCEKLVSDHDAEKRFTDDKASEHRLFSDYIRVLYDDGIERGIKASTTKKVNPNLSETQKRFDKLSDILEDVEKVHKAISACATEEELN